MAGDRTTRAVGSSTSGTVAPAPVETTAREEAIGPGDRVGRYLLRAKIGAGGMGVVFSAHDEELDRRIAIKLVRPTGRGDERDEARLRLLREAQAMAQLQHPNVVPVFDVGTAGDHVYIAMQLVEGTSLRAWLAAGPHPWAEVVRVFVAAGRGLAAAHAAGIVHRDFKPSNVVIARDGQARVLDFGLALAMPGRASFSAVPPPTGRLEASTDDPTTDRLGQPLTRAGIVMGTPSYMAPEQHAGAEVDARGDQYGFCVALYAALFGTLPFRGKTTQELHDAKCRDRPEPPARGEDVPPAVRAVVRRGLAPVPDRRFASMDDLLHALARAASPRRGRLALGGATLAVFGAAAFVATRGEPAAACREEAASAPRWDEERRREVRTALLADADAFSQQTITRVESTLDDWVDRFAVARADLCDARADADDPSAADLRLACLDQRRSAFDAAVDVLASTEGVASDELATRALAVVRRLPPPECDARALGALSSLDDGRRAQASLVRTELDRAAALLEGGRYAEALTTAKSAREQARALDHPPLVAEAEYAVGSALVFSAQPADAEPVLAEAAHLAEAIDDATLAARAATRLAFAEGVLGADAEEGLRWARHGRAMLARVGDPGTEAALLTSLAAVYEKAGDAAEAEAVARRAVDLWTSVEGERGVETAAARNNLAMALYDQGRYDDAIDEYQDVIAIREDVLGPLHPDTAVAHNNLANALLELRRTEDAHAHHQRALEIWIASLGADHPTVAAAWNNLGNAALQLGRLDEAEADYRASLRVRQAVLPADHPDLASTVMNVGVVLAMRDDLSGAIARFRRAKGMLERSVGPDHRLVVTCRANLAEMLRLEGDLAAALEEQREVVAARERLLGPEHPELAAAELGMGFVLLDLKRPDEAAVALRRAISIYARSGGDPTQRARAELLLGTALEDTDPDEARTLVERALTTFGEHPELTTERADAEAWLREHPAAR